MCGPASVRGFLGGLPPWGGMTSLGRESLGVPRALTALQRISMRGFPEVRLRRSSAGLRCRDGPGGRGDVQHVVRLPAFPRARAGAGSVLWRRRQGAVPVQVANRVRSAHRVTSPISARIRAVTTGPRPGRSISLEPLAQEGVGGLVTRAAAMGARSPGLSGHLSTTPSAPRAGRRRRRRPPHRSHPVRARPAPPWRR
jgi:hypothetical protein